MEKEKKYAFRNALREDDLEGIVMKILERNDPAKIEDICRESGRSCLEVRATLDVLVRKGDVERLRPWKYDRDDMDFFRLQGPLRRPKFNLDRSRWQVIRRRINGLFNNSCSEGDIEHCF